MNFSKGKSIFIILLIVVTGVSVGVYYYEQAQKNQFDVRIAYIEGDLHHLAYYIAQEKGFYVDAGLKVRAIPQANGAAIMNNFIAGEVDMAYLGFAPAVFNRFNNPAAEITVLSAVNVDGTALVVKNVSTIQNASDLNGLRIAVPALNNMQDFVLSMILDLAELSHANVNVSVMSVGNMPLLLEANQIDGYVAWEPYAVKGLENNVGKYLYQSGDVWPNHPCCVLAGQNDFIENNPDIAEKVIKVHIETTAWILAHWDEAMNIAMEKMYLNHDQAEEAMDHIGYVSDFNIPQMVTFVDKVIQYNPNVNFSSPGIPAGINNSTAYIDWFVDPSIMQKIKN